MEKKKAYHFSEHLKELIYNPDIPMEWITVKDKRNGMRLFHGLFMAMHPDFEKIVGPELEKLIKRFEGLTGKKKLANNHWIRLGTDDVECSPIKEGCSPKCKYHPACFIPFGPLDFYYLFTRNNIHKISDMNEVSDSLGRTSRYSGIKDPIQDHDGMRKYLNEIEFEKYLKMVARDEENCFSSYKEMRHAGFMPSQVYAIINIHRSLPELKKDLEYFVKEKLKLNSEQFPQDKPEPYTKLKSDGRREGLFDLNTMARRFQAYVYDKQRKKNREIAALLFPELKEKETTVAHLLRDAKNLIENAWK